MATITTNFGFGGANLTPGGASGTPTLAEALRDVADDLTELRTQFIALLAKMDTDFTGQNGAVINSGLDVNYESTLTPSALLTIKG